MERFDDLVRYVLFYLRFEIHLLEAFGIYPYNWTGGLGCTRVFAYLLVKSNPAWLEEKLLAAVPRSVKMIIGRPGFHVRDLLAIPLNPISELLKYGCYVDVVELFGRFAAYVGSATGKDGIFGRWLKYQSPTAEEAHGLHLSTGYSEGAVMHVRRLATFDESVHRIFALVLETIFMVILRVIVEFDSNKPRPHWATEQAFAWLKTVTPEDVAGEPDWDGLNRIWPLSQGCRGDPRHPRKCKTCERTDQNVKYFNVVSDQPFEAHQCQNCLDYLRRTGEDRTMAHEERRRGDHRPLPEHGYCEKIGCVNLLDSPPEFVSAVQRWYCRSCKEERKRQVGDNTRRGKEAAKGRTAEERQAHLTQYQRDYQKTTAEEEDSESEVRLPLPLAELSEQQINKLVVEKAQQNVSKELRQRQVEGKQAQKELAQIRNDEIAEERAAKQTAKDRRESNAAQKQADKQAAKDRKEQDRVQKQTAKERQRQEAAAEEELKRQEWDRLFPAWK